MPLHNVKLSVDFGSSRPKFLTAKSGSKSHFFFVVVVVVIVVVVVVVVLVLRLTYRQ